MKQLNSLDISGTVKLDPIVRDNKDGSKIYIAVLAPRDDELKMFIPKDKVGNTNLPKKGDFIIVNGRLGHDRWQDGTAPNGDAIWKERYYIGARPDQIQNLGKLPAPEAEAADTEK